MEPQFQLLENEIILKLMETVMWSRIVISYTNLYL